MPGFDLPEDESSPESEGNPAWREADVRRAIAIAEEAGLKDYRVEIAIDGTIAIVVGAPADAGEGS